MKKILSVLLILMIVFSLSGCKETVEIKESGGNTDALVHVRNIDLKGSGKNKTGTIHFTYVNLTDEPCSFLDSTITVSAKNMFSVIGTVTSDNRSADTKINHGESIDISFDFEKINKYLDLTIAITDVSDHAVKFSKNIIINLKNNKITVEDITE